MPEYKEKQNPEESYTSKYQNKELLMNKEDNENFKNSNKFWICDNHYVDNAVKVRNYCHITGKYGGSAHSDCANQS